MGALAGFLVYNFNPASIFMGDSGSLFVGLTLSTLALSPVAGARAGSGVLSAIGAPVLLLLIPIFDTTLVTVLRLLSGRRPSQGGTDHSSHRLVAIGLPERTAVMVLWTLAAHRRPHRRRVCRRPAAVCGALPARCSCLRC